MRIYSYPKVNFHTIQSKSLVGILFISFLLVIDNTFPPYWLKPIVFLNFQKSAHIAHNLLYQNKYNYLTIIMAGYQYFLFPLLRNTTPQNHNTLIRLNAKVLSCLYSALAPPKTAFTALLTPAYIAT